MNYQRSQIREKKLSSFIKIGIYCLLLLGLFFLWISWTGSTPIQLEKKVTIPKGTATANLDTLLGVKVSHTRYILWRMFFAPSLELESGAFAVPEGTNTLKKAFIMLQNPVPTEEDITLLPGWHKGEMSEAFKKAGISGDLLSEEQTLIQEFSSQYPFLMGRTSLEGFLMPDTYRITGNTDVKTLVGKMLDNFNKRIYQPFLASGKPVDAFYDVLILASIV